MLDSPVDSNRGLGQLFSSGESDQVIQTESPRSQSRSTFPLSTNPFFSRTRNEARFHARTVAYRRVRPVSWAAESIAHDVSVSYPPPCTRWNNSYTISGSFKVDLPIIKPRQPMNSPSCFVSMASSANPVFAGSASWLSILTRRVSTVGRPSASMT